MNAKRQAVRAGIKFLFMSGLGKGGKDLSINIGASCTLFSDFKYSEKASWICKPHVYPGKVCEVRNFG